MKQCRDLQRACKMCIPCYVHLFKPALVLFALNHAAILQKSFFLQSPEVLPDTAIPLFQIGGGVEKGLLVSISILFKAWNSTCHNTEGETKAQEKLRERY